ncbi:MAG: CvpA family protein [Candidatus Omnitrophica bacterium]|nr:CvpA family protein [Candidatus Omnitrophota bacterium]
MKEFISRLTWVDYLAAAAVLRGSWVGYRSGFFPELLRIAAYLAVIVVTFRFHEALTQVLTLHTFFNFAAAQALSFAVLIIGAFSLAKLVTFLLLKLLKLGEGGFVYRLAGLAAGACRWVLLLSLAFLLIGQLPLSPLKADIEERSLTGPGISMIAPALFDFLSQLSPQLGVEEGKKAET